MERKRLAEHGSLGDLVHDHVPQTFRNALWYLVFHPESHARRRMLASLDFDCRTYFGWPSGRDIGEFILTADTDDLLSFVEMLVESANRRWNDTPYVHASPSGYAVGIPGIAEALNSLFERHRFGYRLEKGEVHKVGSPLLAEQIIGPSLLSVKQPGWEQAERSYREALSHQRGGETDDALTAAHAALEAALKAVGFSGQFGAMVKQLRTSPFLPSYLRGTPDVLSSFITLLERTNAIRSNEGDAHGKAPGADEVPQELADLAIHWAGAFIVFLAEVSRSSRSDAKSAIHRHRASSRV